MSWDLRQAAAAFDAVKIRDGQMRRRKGEPAYRYAHRVVAALRAALLLDDPTGSKYGKQPAVWSRVECPGRVAMSHYINGIRRHPQAAAALIEAGAVDLCPCGWVSCDGCGE